MHTNDTLGIASYTLQWIFICVVLVFAICSVPCCFCMVYIILYIILIFIALCMHVHINTDIIKCINETAYYLIKKTYLYIYNCLNVLHSQNYLPYIYFTFYLQVKRWRK